MITSNYFIVYTRQKSIILTCYIILFIWF